MRSERLSLVFSCLGHGYMHMFTAFYFVVVLALEETWSLPYHELIELWTLGALLVGLGAIPAGWLADRWSSTGMMVVYFVGLGLSGILCGLLDRPEALLFGLAALGLFASIYHPVGIAWLVRSAKNRGTALGINGIFGSLGVALAGLTAGGLIDAFGWRAAYIVPGVVVLLTGLALLACLALGLIVESRHDRHAETPPTRKDMLRVYLILVLTMLIMGLIFQATQAAMPKLFDLRLDDLAGQGTLGIGAIVAAVYVAGGFMQVVGGRLADRYPLKPIYVIAWFCQLPVLLAMAAVSGLPLVAVAVLAVVLTAAAVPAENVLLARYTPQRHRSLAFGVKFVLSFTAAPLAIKLVASVQEQTAEFVWLFLILAGIAAIAALAAAFLPGERRLQAVPQAAE